MEDARDIQTQRSALHRRLQSREASRLSLIIGDLAEALCAVVDKHQLTSEDMQAVHGFATDVGLSTDDKRDEWVLLLDTMGLTSAVEAANLNRPAEATPQTILGPFYRPNAPFRKNGETISIDKLGTPLTFDAQIQDTDSQPIKDAMVDVWHANSDGLFENQDPDSQPEFNLRGRFQTDTSGKLTFRTIRPAGYRLPDDGPVAQLMMRLNLSMWRPANIQFRVQAKGFQTLVTQVFDRADPHIASDPLFCVAPELITDFTEPSSTKGCHARFTFKLARSEPGLAQN